MIAPAPAPRVEAGPGLTADPGRTAHLVAMLHPLAERTGATVSVNAGWDLAWETAQWAAAARAHRPHLSVRLLGAEALVGPLWVPGTPSGCAGCAEARLRIAADHPLVEEFEVPCRLPGDESPFLPELLEAAVRSLLDTLPAPGELRAVGGPRSGRHRVRRSLACPVCGGPPAVPVDVSCPPPRWQPASRPAEPHNPVRSLRGRTLLDRSSLREQVVDPRFGPVLGVIRDTNAPFAMSSAVHPDAKAWGYGRAPHFDRSEPLAVLEVYERLAGFPHHGAVLTDTPYEDLRDRALDPASLGQYTPQQLAHPMSRVLPGDATTPRDWVWGHRLRDGEPLLVPAEVGFYQYEYTERMARHRARRAPADRRRRHFQPESSSGCALGASLEEATLHSLFELAERDAFLLAFHRARPLPAVDPRSLDDPVSRMLLDSIEARGYDAHLLVITQDIGIPAVWALAVHREGGFPATWSAAGSGIDPADAVRGALWELAQLVREPVDWERADAERLLADPYQVDVLKDHYVLYSLPQTLPRITSVLGGPAVGLDEAFPGAAERFRSEAGGDVLGALRWTERLFAAAGLDTVVVVDQTTREHADLGLAVAKAVVPGIVPMCFGHAQQRLTGLPRLERALAEEGRSGATAPYDPHPFP
ncbi:MULTISPECIES: TOMM precursor leader peptide-binding protein [Streptomyces]|uniref:TOMM precursor leader peptide-binding protein n=1 Tax=Streptomyces TaxID=1883 RepID=UPI001E5DD1AA|nr:MULTISPECIES: TOMM precursor leader peptide-binding protein [Streptomyces]UFQ14047.1 TOMM precursor leader peptide-binding protein [Streptomyces huasconensis]WCL83645.1 TOMM precursor leader peptide-binding protein [Streptomyces sp. JCM 35825]